MKQRLTEKQIVFCVNGGAQDKFMEMISTAPFSTQGSPGFRAYPKTLDVKS